MGSRSLTSPSGTASTPTCCLFDILRCSTCLQRAIANRVNLIIQEEILPTYDVDAFELKQLRGRQ